MALKSTIECIQQVPKTIALALIKFYRLVISPLFPGCCRFVPTCSEYGMIAIQKHGFLRGTYLIFRRILRCRPGGGKGYDPVP